MIRAILSAGAMFAALSAVPANADCALTDVVGTWQFYDANATSRGTGWVRCFLVVQANGGIAGASVCYNTTGQKTPVTGRVSITSPVNCTFLGYIRYNLNGEISNFTEATMSKNKDMLAGVGRFSGSEFIFNMLKIK